MLQACVPILADRSVDVNARYGGGRSMLTSIGEGGRDMGGAFGDGFMSGCGAQVAGCLGTLIVLGIIVAVCAGVLSGL